jgi:hypothetical protein
MKVLILKLAEEIWNFRFLVLELELHPPFLTLFSMLSREPVRSLTGEIKCSNFIRLLP